MNLSRNTPKSSIVETNFAKTLISYFPFSQDLNHFFASQSPPLVRYDPELEHHKRFLDELRAILTVPKEELQRHPCYANEENLTPLRRAACRVLSTCHYLAGEDQANIFGALFTAMRAEDEELSREVRVDEVS